MKRFAAALGMSLLLVACSPNTESTESSDAPSAPAFTGTHTEVDMEKSSINFEGKSSIINHPGTFEEFSLTLIPDAATPSDFAKANIVVSIKTSSAKTDAEFLDKHLQSKEFFDSEAHPMATFSSKKIELIEGNKYAVTGDLFIKGITKEVTMEMVAEETKLTLAYDIQRDDFELGKDSYGDKLLSEEVPLTAEIYLK